MHSPKRSMEQRAQLSSKSPSRSTCSIEDPSTTPTVNSNGQLQSFGSVQNLQIRLRGELKDAEVGGGKVFAEEIFLDIKIGSFRTQTPFYDAAKKE